MSDTPAGDPPTELDRVLSMRLRRALEAGLPIDLAEEFAYALHADLHRLEQLVAAGCPPITAARILI